MKLRDHQLMSYRGIPNWPPAGISTTGKQLQYPKGELGVLRKVILSNTQPFTRCYLFIEHQGEEYIGAVLFDDYALCHRVYKLLLDYRGQTIRQIGEINLPALETDPNIGETCKLCGSSNNCDFNVTDDVWQTVVPPEYQSEIVCLECFENFACEKQVELFREKNV